MNHTPKSNSNSIGESQINPQIMQQVAPDVVSGEGLSQLHQTLSTAISQKQTLDDILKQIAKKTGTEFSSRIKNANTVVQKIAQKRMQGRDYNIDDINDAYGGRFIVDKKSQIPKILEAVRKLAGNDTFKILEDEKVKDGTYSARHIDFQTPDGLKGEIQTMTPQEALEAVANHSLRSVHGEKPPEQVAKLRDKQAAIAKQTPNEEAKKKMQIMQDAAKANQDQPTHPLLNAAVLASKNARYK